MGIHKLCSSSLALRLLATQITTSVTSSISSFNLIIYFSLTTHPTPSELIIVIIIKDRSSIIGDAIYYLNELLQRINDLHNELESTPLGSLPQGSTSFHPLTPTPDTLSCRVNPFTLRFCHPQVEVRLREGRTVKIRQAVISCSNRFATLSFIGKNPSAIEVKLSSWRLRSSP
ncbi:hypothetical protein Bca52824_083367 [Brassica carinata]|uniref:Uncharacterized protein n=1 Tax=Brassica carinata TaxID=52824 RepID=A0A8X7TTS4_BRACI|nr:hypothetical protein Bca52824_083367 [Brassica carinata]